MTYDPSNARLFVSDEYNNRVMIFNAQTPGEPVNDEAASYVLGQTNFTNSNGSNIGYSNVSQSGLSTPNGVAFDPTNDLLYVDDSYNSRLMQFNVAPGTLANGENASDLLGEYSSPTSTATVEWTQNGPNNGPTALGMSIFNDISQPAGYVTLDPVNHYLYVADNNNNRVMIYALNTDNSIPTASGGHTATYVLGQTSLQGGSNANCTASTMDAPMGLAYDSVNNRLFVVQQNQARVLVFDNMSTPSNGMAASYVLGEPNLTTCGYGNTASQSQFGTPWGVAYDAVNQRLFVVDNGWTAGGQGNRVLVFNVAPGTIANGENASYVLGQSNFTNTGTGTTATTMYGPIDAAYDPVNTRLFVSDENNNRVLVFNVPTSVTNGTSYGEAASYVLGASNFTTTGSYGCNNSSTGAPQGLAYDANNSRLFVAQTDCNNVMVFNVAPGGIQNGENASYELGHTNFTSNSSGTSQTQFSSGGYVYYDPGSGRLFVGDSTNNRILIFEGSFGDPNFFLLMPD
jgi:DNA-binding beta-propeller fold protein YncE